MALDRRGKIRSSHVDGKTKYTITEAGADEVLAAHPNYLDIAHPQAAKMRRVRATLRERKEDILSNDSKETFRRAATALGWRWSDAHGGFISESHRDSPGHENDGSWQAYRVCEDAEDACFLDGIADLEQAAALFDDQ